MFRMLCLPYSLLEQGETEPTQRRQLEQTVSSVQAQITADPAEKEVQIEPDQG